ncbi:inter-alpha-trypsin inhibitor heavy chain H1-like [Vulpes vulpes]|uniref:Inter-alpha-trypsin inhibitor heavy chain H1-like n=1 Tax=Vulpes vulpes TaxID=9627 RepID=A0ABM4XFW1_VULVU
MKLEGKEKADVAAKALQMSLAYQFVTPLTSMTIRGMADEDGLEPVIDKPPEDSLPLEMVGHRKSKWQRPPPPSLPLPARSPSGGPVSPEPRRVGLRRK